MVRTVTVSGVARPEVLDKAVRAALGNKCLGISTSPGKMHVHLTDDSAIVDEQAAQAVMENYGALNVSTDKTQIAANGVDTATITYASASAQVYYVAYLGAEVYSDGLESVENGVMTLTLDTQAAGVYRVHIIETTGNFGTGVVTITAV
jgi:hypothetical protein